MPVQIALDFCEAKDRLLHGGLYVTVNPFVNNNNNNNNNKKHNKNMTYLVIKHGHGCWYIKDVELDNPLDNFPVQITLLIERLSSTFTANGRNDHVTLLVLHLQLAVFSFLVKLRSFALASKARIILHYSHLCSHFYKKT